MAINTTDLGIQSAGQNTAIQPEVEQEHLPQPSRPDSVTVNNPAAEEYAERGPTMGTQSAGEEIPAPSYPTTYEEALVQTEYELERARVELEVMQDYLAELEAYLHEAPLTGEDRPNLMEAVVQTRVEIRRRERAVMLAEQKISWMVNYGGDHDFDGDGLTNAQELLNEAEAAAAGRIDPNDPNYVPSYLNADSDGDGLTDLTETLLNRNRPGNEIDMFNADSNSNGVDDWLENNADAADMADHLGVDNWAYGREGFGSGLRSDPFSSDQNFVPPTDDSDTDAAEEPSGPSGPEPDSNAQEVNLAPSVDESDDSAGTQSVGAMGSQSVTETNTDTGMGVQNADETSDDSDDADAPVRTKEQIRQDLLNINYSADQEVSIPAEWADGNMKTYKDVVINGTLESDEYLIMQEGDDLIILTPDKRITIEKGAMRRIFIYSPDGAKDTIVFYNVPMQTIMGGTIAEGGEHKWDHGLFIEDPSETGGFYSAGQAAVDGDPEAETEDPWTWDEQVVEPTDDTQDNGEWVPERNPGIENVYTIWDTFQDSEGNPSDAVSMNGDPDFEIDPDTGTKYPVETWTMTSSADPVHINIPPTEEGFPVWEIEVTQAADDANDMIIVMRARDNSILKKIRIEDGILHGNTNVDNPNMIFHLPSGLNDALGYYQNGYNYGGVYFHADKLEDNYVHVIGGGGNDKIVGSSFQHGVAGKTSDFIDAGAGDDIVESTTAAHIIGGKGHDVLQGSSQDDRIEGGDGNDYIDGGAGSDKLYGDGDNDFLVTRGTGNEIYGGGGTNLTNVAKENDDNNTVGDDVQHALNNLAGSSDILADLLGMMDYEGLDIDELTELVNGLKQDGIDAVAQKIYEIFGQVQGVYERSFLEGSHVDPTTLPNAGAVTGNSAGTDSDDSTS